jgi:CheY-like chemotaxis protein
MPLARRYLGRAPLLGPGLTRMDILLVEDDADSADLLGRLLTMAGHAVVTAPTIADAERLCASRAFDLLVCDLILPDGNAWDFLARLRETCDTPAIAISGYGMDVDVERSAAAGFAAHLTKPILFPRLVAAIEAATGVRVEPKAAPPTA